MPKVRQQMHWQQPIRMGDNLPQTVVVQGKELVFVLLHNTADKMAVVLLFLIFHISEVIRYVNTNTSSFTPVVFKVHLCYSMCSNIQLYRYTIYCLSLQLVNIWVVSAFAVMNSV